MLHTFIIARGVCVGCFHCRRRRKTERSKQGQVAHFGYSFYFIIFLPCSLITCLSRWAPFLWKTTVGKKIVSIVDSAREFIFYELVIVYMLHFPSPPHLGHVLQLAEHDLPWLNSWAAAVVHASKTDYAERSEPSAENATGSIDTKITRHTPETGSRHRAPLGSPDPIPTTMPTAPLQDGNPSITHTGRPFAASILAGSGGLATDGNAERGQSSVQALRKAMKADIRERYAYSGTAEMWAREISESKKQRTPAMGR